MNNNNLKDFFNYKRNYDDTLVLKTIKTYKDHNDILKSSIDFMTPSFMLEEKDRNISIPCSDFLNSCSDSEKRNFAPILDLFFKTPKLESPSEVEIQDLAEKDLVMISDGENESFLFMITKNFKEECLIEGIPVIEDTLYGIEQSLFVEAKNNTLNSDLAVLSEFKFILSYDLISIETGYLGKINFDYTDYPKNFRKQNQLLDYREPERSRLIKIFNYYSNFEGKEVRKVERSTLLKINQEIALERELNGS